MDTITQLQRWVLTQLNKTLFPIVTNGKLNLNNSEGSVPPASISVNTEAFTNQTSVTVTHDFSRYPIVQVLTVNGQIMKSAIITHISTNEFKVTFPNDSRGWGMIQWGSSGWGGGGGGTRWGSSSWGSAGWGSTAAAQATASGTILYL